MAAVSASPEMGPTRLSKRLPAALGFNGTPLSVALPAIAKSGHITIVADWPALHASGIEPTDPVTAQLGGVSVARAIRDALDSVEGEAGNHRAFMIPGEDGRSVTITSLRVLRSTRTIVDYRVGDLAATARDSRPDEALDELAQYVVQNVDPDNWVENGGDVGVLVIDRGARVLHVLQTPENQQKVISVLRTLRETWGMPEERQIAYPQPLSATAGPATTAPAAQGK